MILTDPYLLFERYVNRLFKRNGMQMFSLRTPHHRIEYWDNQRTDKPVLILLQAFAAESKYSWYKQIRALSPRFRLIVPNLIFFGKSQSDQPDYSIDHQVCAMKELIEGLNLCQVMLTGASYGGIIAAELGKTMPDRVSKIALSNSPLKYLDPHENDHLLEKIGVKEKADLLVPQSPKNLKFLFSLSYHRKVPLPGIFFKSVYRHLYADANHKRQLIEHYIGHLEDYHQREYPLKMPVLLIWGKEDQLAPVYVAHELIKHIGDQAVLIEIHHAAHMANLEKAKKYNREILNFLLND